jgi:hypothetical protein
MGFGGIHVESIRDVAYALPPIDSAAARRLVDGLQLRPLLDAQRGKPAADIEAFCGAAASLSLLAAALADEIGEIDVNPVLLTEDGCIALDALVAAKFHDDLNSIRSKDEPGPISAA